jgi:hypothetical protein
MRAALRAVGEGGGGRDVGEVAQALREDAKQLDQSRAVLFGKEVEVVACGRSNARRASSCRTWYARRSARRRRPRRLLPQPDTRLGAGQFPYRPRERDEGLRLAHNRLADFASEGVTACIASLILYLVEDVQTGEGTTGDPRATSTRGSGQWSGRVAISRAFGGLREAGSVEQKDRLIHVVDSSW